MLTKTLKLLISFFTFIFLFSCQQKEEWIELFNGENLDGWAPKITGYELNDNYKNTFRVEDGYLTVNYDRRAELRRGPPEDPGRRTNP